MPFGIFGILVWPIKNSRRLTHIIVLSEWDVRLAWIWVTAKRMRFTCRTITAEANKKKKKKKKAQGAECQNCSFVSRFVSPVALLIHRFSSAFAAFPHSVFIMKQAFFFIYIFHSFRWCCSGLMVYAIRVR